MLLLRARREERLLAQEFGESWHEYCNRVPMLFPFRLRNSALQRLRISKSEVREE
jgi:hypothetical protein